MVSMSYRSRFISMSDIQKQYIIRKLDELKDISSLENEEDVLYSLIDMKDNIPNVILSQYKKSWLYHQVYTIDIY